MNARRAVQAGAFGLGALGLLLGGCTHVEVLRFTQQQFPAKSSPAAVDILDATPKNRPFLQVAELRVTQDNANVSDMQQAMLKRAAELGADAVVFSHPHTSVVHHVTYATSPWYGPYGAYGPYGPYGGGYVGMGWGHPYGWGSPWGMGWGGPWGGWSSAMPYDVQSTTLTGIAIRYTGDAAH